MPATSQPMRDTHPGLSRSPATATAVADSVVDSTAAQATAAGSVADATGAPATVADSVVDFLGHDYT